MTIFITINHQHHHHVHYPTIIVSNINNTMLPSPSLCPTSMSLSSSSSPSILFPLSLSPSLPPSSLLLSPSAHHQPLSSPWFSEKGGDITSPRPRGRSIPHILAPFFPPWHLVMEPTSVSFLSHAFCFQALCVQDSLRCNRGARSMT